MMHCVRIVGEDSVEAMAKVTRELGADAVILSTRQVRDGIEIIASRGDAVNEVEAGDMRAAAGSAKARAEEFAALLEKKRMPHRPSRAPLPRQPVHSQRLRLSNRQLIRPSKGLKNRSPKSRRCCPLI